VPRRGAAEAVSDQTLVAEQIVAAAIDEVFAFFADARNLEALTPAWLRFRILTPDPIRMGVGTRIDYRLRLHGLPLRWRSEITAWDPPRRFVDEQRRGPYRRWVHEHLFEPAGSRTRVRDRVVYAVPGGPLVARILVAPDLRRIFAYRAARLEERFGAAPPDDHARPGP
jgi:ligand-binding SRPBCC domain-containing protein